MSQTLTIAGKSYTAEPKYKAGDVLTANEAAALNQTRFENLRNNFATKAKDGGTQADFDAYAASYEFGVRSAGSRDPIITEAMNIARERVRDAIKRGGKQIKEYTAEQISNAAAKLVETKPEIRELAKQRVAAMREAVGETGADDILADLAASPAETGAPAAEGDAPAEGKKRGK